MSEKYEEGIEDEKITRRDAIGKIVKTVAVISAAPIVLTPQEASAGSTLDYTPALRGNYADVVNTYRRLFGRRQDYQQGFEAAMQNSNRVTELPTGLYGILPEQINPANPRAIQPGPRFPVERTGYLHATQEIGEDNFDSLSERWLKAEGALHKGVKESVYRQYRNYDTDLFKSIRLPVVTLNNYDQQRLEMFLRIPAPDTMEYSQMVRGRWADYYDQSKLRHEQPFMTLYNPSLNLYENLTIIYGDELQVLRQAGQATGRGTARFIQAMDNWVRRTFGARYALSRAKKNSLNNLLGVAGTPDAIR